jgi:hypothetical protein
VIGSIEFAAGDSDGTDGATVAAGIHAIAEDTFSATANATKLVFTTGVSETAAASATAKMTLSSAGVLDVDGGITVDNITIDGTEIDLSSGDLTLDVAGSIVLNADSGSINLADDSTTFAELINSSSDFVVKSSQNDKDIIFKGVDNSSLITALTLDMSAAGNAIFNNDVTVGNDIKLLSDASVLSFGTNSEVTLTHVHDKGLALKHTATADDKPVVLILQTGETDIAVNDDIGGIDFMAPDEGAGGDAVLTAASITAVSEGDFSSSNNATKLSFRTAASEAATEKMSLSSGGNLTISGNLIIGSATVTEAQLEILDGATVTTTELNLVDGSSAGSIVNSKAVIYSGAGVINATDMAVSGSGNRSISITSTDGIGSMEIGAAAGNAAFIDFKTPSSDDFDVRIGSLAGGAGGSISIAGGTFSILGSAETMATFVDDGAVSLRFDNAVKLATDTAGTTVTGTGKFSVGTNSFAHLDGTVHSDGGDRALNTNYTNSSAFDKVIYVSVSNTAANALMIVVLDGDTIYLGAGATGDANYHIGGTFIWPAGKVININMNGTPTLSRWVEYA